MMATYVEKDVEENVAMQPEGEPDLQKMANEYKLAIRHFYDQVDFNLNSISPSPKPSSSSLTYHEAQTYQKEARWKQQVQSQCHGLLRERRTIHSQSP